MENESHPIVKGRRVLVLLPGVALVFQQQGYHAGVDAEEDGVPRHRDPQGLGPIVLEGDAARHACQRRNVGVRPGQQQLVASSKVANE